MDKKQLELAIDADIVLDTSMTKQPVFLDEHRIMCRSSDDKLTIIDIRSKEKITGLDLHLDLTSSAMSTVTSINNLYRSKREAWHYDFHFYEDVPEQTDQSHYLVFLQNDKLYILTVCKTTEPKKLTATLEMFSIVGSCSMLEGIHAFSLDVDYNGSNQIKCEHIRISKKMYCFLHFRNSKKPGEYHIVDYDKFVVTQVSGSPYSVYKENLCSCHRGLTGFSKHTGVFPIRWKTSCFLYEFSKNRVHEIEGVSSQDEFQSDDLVCYTYSKVTKKFLLTFPKRILILPDLTDTSRRERSFVFNLEKRTDELILGASSQDNLRSYESIITYNSVNSDPFITSFDMLASIIHDAIHLKNDKVTLTYKVNDVTKTLDVSIDIDVFYRTFSLEFVLHCTKSPYDPETEIKKIKEELENLTKKPKLMCL